MEARHSLRPVQPVRKARDGGIWARRAQFSIAGYRLMKGHHGIPGVVKYEETTDLSIIPTLVGIENRCFTAYYAQHRFEANNFKYYFHNKQTINIVALSNSMAVGYTLGIVGTGRATHIARLYSLAVERPFRKHGVASALVLRFAHQASTRSCEVVHAEVATRNAPALLLLESLGFERQRKLPDYYGDNVDAVQMRLIL